MLTKEENELITKVGPGTVMGDLMRQYWIPALLSEELPEPDGRPVRVRLLGEDLIAYRDTMGRVGMLANNCAHRGASLYFGRNEDCGLRCSYHGWKFDVTGQCVEMPNEPAESNFKNKIKQTAYPCEERNGLIWTYMGSRQSPPPLPDFEWNTLSDNIPIMWKYKQPCNWLQVLEGALDSSHVNYLHKVISQNEDQVTTTPGQHWPGNPGGVKAAYGTDGTPRLEVLDTDFGVLYTAKRLVDDNHEYHRIHPFLFPYHTMTGMSLNADGEMESFNGKAWIPMDDENTLVFEWDLRPGNPWTEEEKEAMIKVRMPEGFREATTEPGGAWRPRAGLDNDYLLDYDLHRSELFIGIKGNPMQDAAVTESMGPIFDRSKEHLGSGDAAIIRMRHRLLRAARALREKGIVPPGVEQPEVYRIRPAGAILPVGADWAKATQHLVRLK